MSSRAIVILGLGVIVLLFVVVVAYLLYFSGGIVTFDVIPPDAVASIDGRTYKASAKIRLSPGTHKAVLSSNGFINKEIQVAVKAGKTTVLSEYLSLDPSSSVGAQKINSLGLAQEYEGRGGEKIEAGAQSIRNDNPLIKLLPYIQSTYRVDYGASQKNAGDPNAVAIYITAPTPQAKQAALAWIKSQGYDPATLEIIYQ